MISWFPFKLFNYLGVFLQIQLFFTLILFLTTPIINTPLFGYLTVLFHAIPEQVFIPQKSWILNASLSIHHFYVYDGMRISGSHATNSHHVITIMDI